MKKSCFLTATPEYTNALRLFIKINFSQLFPSVSSFKGYLKKYNLHL
jgi:hypothetical protein